MINYSKIEVEISIIVPVYNIPVGILNTTIDSITKQSFKNFELLIIDDGSEDDCRRLCDGLCKLDSRINVLHKINGGVSSARNIGIETSKGKYMAFIDAGDVVGINYLESLYNSIKESKTDIAVCGCQFISDGRLYKNKDNNYESKVVNNIDAVYDLCYMNHPFRCIEVTAVWGSLFKKTAIGNIRFNEKMVIGEDFDFKFKVYNGIRNVIYINKPIYGYVVSDGSAIHKKFSDKHYDTFQEFKRILNEFDDDKKVRSALQCRVVNMDILFLLRNIDDDSIHTEIENHIMQNRCSVLLNNKARKKVKFALILSIFGFDFMRSVFLKLNR